MGKILKGLSIFFTSILIIVVIAGAVLAGQRILQHKSMPTIFGYAPAIVLSGSMEPALSVNDLVVIKEEKNYKKGDIATYVDEKGKLITHRIVKNKGENYVFQGDANNTADPTVLKENVKGKVVASIPFVGYIFSLQAMVIILAIVIIFILCPVLWRFINKHVK